MGYTHAEILEMIAECDGDKDAIIAILKKYSDPVLSKTLFFLFDPNIEFNITWIPEYIPSDAPYGHQFIMFGKVYNHFDNYILGKNTDYSEESRELMLKRNLENLHANDAKILEMIIKRKKPDIQGLDADLIREVYPNLLSDVRKDTLNEFFL